MGERKRQALVLAGGASHGAYHVGVIRALLTGQVGSRNAGKRRGVHATDLEPDIIAGISAGAFNGAVLLSQLEANKWSTQKAADYLEYVWLRRLAESRKRQGNGVLRFRGDPSELFNPEGLARGPLKPLSWVMGDTAALMREAVGRGVGFQESNKPLLRRLTEQVNLSSFVSMKPFEKSIRKSIHFESLQNSKRDFIAGAVGWEDGIMRYFTNRNPIKKTVNRYLNPDGKPLYVVGNFSKLGPKIIRASAAVPGIFPLVKLDDELFCDGAAIENTPLSCAIKFDADILHVVTSVPPVDSMPTPRLPNTFDTLYRFIVTREAETIRDDLLNAEEFNNNVTIATQLRQELDKVTKQLKALEDSLDGVRPTATKQLQEMTQRLQGLGGNGAAARSSASDRSLAALAATDVDNEVAAFIHKFAARDKRMVGTRGALADEGASGNEPKKKLEIHVYRPEESLGGILSLLKFDRKFLDRMIERGYKDALDHDCVKNRCILLDSDPPG